LDLALYISKHQLDVQFVWEKRKKLTSKPKFLRIRHIMPKVCVEFMCVEGTIFHHVHVSKFNISDNHYFPLFFLLLISWREYITYYLCILGFISVPMKTAHSMPRTENVQYPFTKAALRFAIVFLSSCDTHAKERVQVSRACRSVAGKTQWMADDGGCGTKPR